MLRIRFPNLFLIFFIVFFLCDKLPEEQIVQRLPSYYNVYLDGRAKEILQAKDQMEDCEAFFWITDIQWEPDLNARRSPAMIRYLATKTGIDKILNGGDTGNSSVICSNAIDRLRDAIGSEARDGVDNEPGEKVDVRILKYGE